nr:hypothetical protein [Tanacetum cinerariifolium]
MTPSTIATTITTSQAPILPTTVSSTIIQNLPNFGSLFGFDNRLRTLEANFAEFMQTNQFAGVVSAIPGIVQRYMDQWMNEAFGFDNRLRTLEANFTEFMQTNQFAGVVSAIPGIVQRYMDQWMNEAVKVAVQIQSNHLCDEAQRENDEFLKIVDENMNLYKALVEAFESDKIILDTYGETVTLKRRRDDDADKDEEPSAGPAEGQRDAEKETSLTKASKAESLSALSEVAMTEAQQLKLITKRSMQQMHISQASGSGVDDGTGSIPGVVDVPTDESEEELSWNSTDDEGADDEGKDGDDDEGDEGDDAEEGDGDDDDDDDDDLENEGDEGGDYEEKGNNDEQASDKEEFIYPSLSTHAEEEPRDEEIFDPILKTPKNSDDEGNGEENVGREEGHNEEEEEDELYRGVNINQGRGIRTTQEFEDSHVTLTLSKESTLQLVYDVLRITPFFNAFLATADVPEIYMQEFWATATVHHHAIRFKMDNKKYIINLESFRDMLHICLRVPELTNADIRNSNAYKEYYAIATGAAPPKPKASVRKTRSSSDTTITPPTAVKGPRLTTSEKGKQAAKASKAKSLSALSKMKELVLYQGFSMYPLMSLRKNSLGILWMKKDKESFDPIPKTPKNSDDEGNGEEDLGLNVSREEGHDEEEEEDELYRDVNINQERGIQITLEVKDSHVTLYPVNPDGQQQSSSVSSQFVTSMLNPTLNAGMESIFETTSQMDVQTPTSVAPLPMSVPTITPSTIATALVEAYESDKIILDTYGETITLKRRRDDDADKDEEPSVGPDRGSKRRREVKEPESASAPTKTATRSAGSGPTYELLKGSCKSLVELEYHLEEVYKATTDQLDWINPEGQQYPHNLLKPLPLIPNNRGRRVIPFDHFINNDLEYLCGGASSRKYTTFVTKTKAADYGHIKWIEDLGQLINSAVGTFLHWQWQNSSSSGNYFALPVGTSSGSGNFLLAVGTSSGSRNTSLERNLYKAFVEAYKSDKIILDTYGDAVTLKRRRDDDADKDEEPFAGPDRGSKRRREGKEPESASAPKEKATRSVGADDQPIIESSQHPEWFSQQKKPPTPYRDWNKTLPATHGSIQPWISELTKQSNSRSSFNELMDTPMDFSNFLMNRLRVDTLTPKLLAGPTYKLMKGSCKSLESARDVYSKQRIIAITELKILEWHNYKHFDWITVQRDDDKLYKFKEGDFKRLGIQDIEDMLLLLVQGKLTNPTVKERFAFNVSFRMFTRSIVIQRRVEDLQLGVESYQKKLNLKKLDTYRSDLKRKEAYIAYSNPRGFIYQNKDKQKRLTRIDKLHKFNDGTLTDVRTALKDSDEVFAIVNLEEE